MTYPVSRRQGTPTQTKVTLVAAAPATIVAPSPFHNGARVLNWTITPVYLAPGITGTPASGAPSDVVPAAVGGVPGQWNASYAPTTGLRGIGAEAGDLTVAIW